MQQLAKGIDGVQRNPVDAEDAPPEMKEAIPAATTVWLELVNDTDLEA